MIELILKKIFLFLMYGMRPLLGPSGCCKFSVTCTRFAEVQMAEHHLHTALINITKRVWSCGPF